MKWLGACIILIASFWIGLEQSRKLSERPRQLRMLKSALKSFEAEIVFGYTPLHESSRKLSERLPSPIADIFSSFAVLLTTSEMDAKEAWKQSVAAVWPRTALKPSEYDILVEFGETLGRYDRQTEQKHILLALTHIERCEEEAIEKQRRYESMLKSLSVLGGLLLILLLF
ncbi:stage III sporulation protein AB [Bacillus ectoiniformans]|uniref:stage III sporulation protein SpoIIIAB n=1 Tax=Bacillus ectoiniformans TaxID=1494429 RepID=UPI0019589AB0|nr:stage III sporulation protein SpoIIIAB [Bacillus ectoiniformans]MBM7650442.1 stage III sporulation protein AB [Bacillus ectoiniformans]